MPHTRPTYRKGIAGQDLRSWDPWVHARTVVQSDHRVIHDSRGFSLAVSGSLANAASNVLMAKVPAGTFMHWRFGSIGVDDTPFNVDLHEGVTVSADGTPITSYCNNRISKATSDVSLFSGPTITDTGTLLIPEIVRGSGASPVGQPHAGLIDQLGAEWIFTNDNITLTITNNSGATAGYTGRFFWYEIDSNYTEDL